MVLLTPKKLQRYFDASITSLGLQLKMCAPIYTISEDLLTR